MQSKWRRINLLDVCSIKTGKHDANHAVVNGRYRFYTCASEYSYSNTYVFDEPSIIIPGNGDIGLVFYYDGKFDAYQRTYVLYNIRVNPRYLYYHLLFKWRHINANKQFGSTIRYVRMKNFSNYELIAPPIPEQERIVAKIEELFSELDKGVGALQKIKEQLKVYRQAVLKDVFDKYKSFSSVTDYFDITGGLTKNSKRNTLPIQMPYMRVANVYYNLIDLTEVKEIGVNINEINRTLLKEQDILFVEGNGSKEQIGRVAIWNGEIERCLHQNHIIKARPTGNMLSDFALYYFMSKDGRNQILQVASSTSGLYTLSINKVKNLQVPACSLEEQRETISLIESRISICEHIEKSLGIVEKKAESLRQSILKKAFEGKLVTQEETING